MNRVKTSFFVALMCITLFMGYLYPYPLVAGNCEQWIAKVVSVQGVVQAKKAGDAQWTHVKLNETFCPGDMLRVQKNSRAAVVLSNETVARLDQKTSITFTGVEEEKVSLIDLIKGVAHFFSRAPRSLKITTPFVNGAVEGTEFMVEVSRDQTLLSVFRGRVAAANEVGSLRLASGQAAIARAGKAPVAHVVARPRDAVRWAIYYPAVIDYRADEFEGDAAWQGKVRKSVRFYREGALANAFSSLDNVPETVRDPRFYTYRAGLLLTVGRVDEAAVDIEKALGIDPGNSRAISLQSIVAVAQNRKDKALGLAKKAVAKDSSVSAAHLALSYAQQARFDVKGALESVQKAVAISPENALAWARLSELWMSVGDLDRALEAAQKAASLNPNLAHTQTVLGFARLAQIKTKDSRAAFETAIELDQAAPLPRLGLGLAKIREGDLEPGRAEIEIAAGLDPNNSLIRSYLGKAFFDEKRDKQSDSQLAIAKELDPQDPTPYFYDAIRKQTLNRPVEALQDIQKSIELNDNRAVYRSRLLLDEDLAARSASLGRIYHDLGFQQLALVEGWKSVNTDPTSSSAHRFLADSYAALPRHEIARVSELLQSQLLQPINITPVQPSLAETNVFLLEGAGPADPSFNEFNPLFLRNRLALQASGVAGENDTYGGEAVHSAVWGRMSYSVGAFHHETDGFRKNNDQELDLYNVFAQMALTHKTSIQAEYRYKEIECGDLGLLFFDDSFHRSFRRKGDTKSIRAGLRHAFGPNSDLLVSIIDLETDCDDIVPSVYVYSLKEDAYMAEGQHLFRSERFNVVSGIGYFSKDQKKVDTYSSMDFGVHHTNFYAYAQINFPQNIWWTLGGSADFYEDDDKDLDEDQFNPKIGFIWNIFPDTTLRAAVFRTLKRSLISNQTLEPTQVAGFNQFFDDGSGADATCYGVAIDHKFSPKLYVGAEFSERDLEEIGEGMPPLLEIKEFDLEESLCRAYMLWTPHPRLALGPEYQFERFENSLEFYKDEAVDLDIHRVSVGINFFHPCGFSARLKPAYIYEDGKFVRNAGPPTFATYVDSGDDRFWVVDGSVSYRLPKRWGIISVEAKNLFDGDFSFQDTDPSNPNVYPERVILGKFTVSF